MLKFQKRIDLTYQNRVAISSTVFMSIMQI